MPITLTPDLEKLVNEEIESGEFVSPHEVLRQSLEMFKERRMPKSVRLENLRREIQKGVDQIRNGQYTTYKVEELDDFAEKIIERGMKKLNGRSGDQNG